VQGKGVKEMEKSFFTTVFDKLRLYERARGAQRGRAAVGSGPDDSRPDPRVFQDLPCGSTTPF